MGLGNLCSSHPINLDLQARYHVFPVPLAYAPRTNSFLVFLPLAAGHLCSWAGGAGEAAAGEEAGAGSAVSGFECLRL